MTAVRDIYAFVGGYGVYGPLQVEDYLPTTMARCKIATCARNGIVNANVIAIRYDRVNSLLCYIVMPVA